ncbi:MAG: YbjN domain-containing protein [Polyangiaceae bacterium]
MRKLGLDPKAVERSSDDQHVTFAVKRGSANVVISTGLADGARFVRVAAPVMVPPSIDTEGGIENQYKLFRRLLELNAVGLSNAAFGLLEGRVIVVSERPAAALQEVELEQMVRHLAAVADTFDDKLVAEFGGVRGAG